VPNYLYQIFSDFGRSMLRPTFSLIVLWFLSACYYTVLSKSNNLLDGLLFSFGQLIPFVPWSKNAKELGLIALYGNGDDLNVPGLVHVVAITEGFIAVVFIFLIGLAFRNRFRI